MKTHEELMAMTEAEQRRYLSDEVQKLLDQIPDSPRKQRLAGLQWKINGLRKTKYKDDPMGLLVELSRMMVSNLGEVQDKFLEIKDMMDTKEVDKP